MTVASFLRIAPLAAAAACIAIACAHPAPTASPAAAASPPAATPSPPVAAATNGVDPALCYSRDRTPVLPPGQTRAAGSVFGRDTALAPDLSDPSAGNTAAAQAQRGDLDKEIVRRIIRRHINEVKACYDTELAAHPYLGGTITVAFLIPASGIVSQTHVSKSTMGYPAVEDCVARTMCGWEFPRPLEGQSVVINYPYKLTPAGGGSDPSP